MENKDWRKNHPYWVEGYGYIPHSGNRQRERMRRIMERRIAQEDAAKWVKDNVLADKKETTK